MRKNRIAFLVYCAATALWINAARAEIRLPALFSDHLVLQQKSVIPVWGWADDGVQVTVEFRNQKQSVVAENGRWMVRLRPEEAGGPEVLLIHGKDEVLVVRDVLVGEVWVCSGQSNMQFRLSRTQDSEAAIANSENPSIRLFQVPQVKADTPQNDVDSQWTLCNPETTPDFSAVAYFFGMHLQESLGVPIGLIHSSWGGSPAEVWIREEVLAVHPDYKREILDHYRRSMERYEAELHAYQQRKASAERDGRRFEEKPPNQPFWKPSELYNGMIAPLLPYAIEGAIWYQGESNTDRAYQYRFLFPDMIRNWRHDWNEGEFPFLFVQLAPWDFNKHRPVEAIVAKPTESSWAELRQAQLLTTKILNNTGMVVITDYGDKDDIHPPIKEPVGRRLALAARGLAYGENIVYSGPIYSGSEIQDNKIILSFEHIGSGLESRGGSLMGFSIADTRRNFFWANAVILDNKVIVSNPSIANPIAVRFGWADYPVVNLYNKEGLPASPFRTDSFPLTTSPKQ